MALLLYCKGFLKMKCMKIRNAWNEESSCLKVWIFLGNWCANNVQNLYKCFIKDDNSLQGWAFNVISVAN